jgi:hypothetical protein
LAERLQRAEQALAKLKVLSEGDLAKVTEQSQALLNRHDVAAYLQVTWTAHTTETKHYLKRGRHGPNSPFEMVTNTTWQVTVTRLPEAIATFNQLAGWRLYVTNAPAPFIASKARYWRSGPCCCAPTNASVACCASW